MPAPPAPTFTPRPDDPRVGIVIGSYGWPGLIELQIRTIRHTCGDVPILICDDRSPRAEQIQALGKRYPGVTVSIGDERIGHVGGDLAAFSRGLFWAHGAGVEFLVKLSHRFLVTVPRWAHDGAISLRGSGKAILAQSWALPIRTECIMMRVDALLDERFLDVIEPKQRSTAAELLIHHGMSLIGAQVEPWPLLHGADRTISKPGILWHDANAAADYHRLAEQFGVVLDSDFTTAGSHTLPNYQAG